MPGHGSQQRCVIVSNPLVRVGQTGSRFCKRSANIVRVGFTKVSYERQYFIHSTEDLGMG